MSAKMYRPKDKVVAGVGAGLAQHLGFRVSIVRFALAASCLLFGTGLLFYAWLWVLVPVQGEDRATSILDDDGNPRLKLFRPAQYAAEQEPQTGVRTERKALGLREILIGGVLVFAAIIAFGGPVTSTIDWSTLLPLIVIAVGAVLAWMQLDASRRAGFLSAAQIGAPLSIARFVAGIILVIVGVLIIVTGSGSLALAWGSIVASLAVLVGVGLVLAPWALKFWRDFQDERAGRIRETERAEIAAHLHDSVLQTLALIQNRADSPQDVTRLARAQERELREWIYQDAQTSHGQLVASLKAVCAEIEVAYGQTVDVVAVGDSELTERSQALVQATRESVLNGVRHGGSSVSVYLESNTKGVDVFIKDRGRGFDITAVPTDRLGVKESVVGRMQRNGGTAEIISSVAGTEVRLHLPSESKTLEEVT